MKDTSHQVETMKLQLNNLQQEIRRQERYNGELISKKSALEKEILLLQQNTSSQRNEIEEMQRKEYDQMNERLRDMRDTLAQLKTNQEKKEMEHTHKVELAKLEFQNTLK